MNRYYLTIKPTDRKCTMTVNVEEQVRQHNIMLGVKKKMYIGITFLLKTNNFGVYTCCARFFFYVLNTNKLNNMCIQRACRNNIKAVRVLHYKLYSCGAEIKRIFSSFFFFEKKMIFFFFFTPSIQFFFFELTVVPY